MLDTLVDLSHHDKLTLQALYEEGIRGIIHKLTQGVDFVDPEYASRVQNAQQLNIKWGAYHFLSGDDVQKQFDLFSSTLAKLTPKGYEVIPCLDWEPDTTTGQQTASFDQLLQMVQLCKDNLDKLPMVYGGYWMIDQLKDKTSSLLGQCPLWQGYYKASIDFPHSIWKKWDLWQYSDGSESSGIFKGVDRDRFNGSEQDMEKFWDTHSIVY